MQDLLANHKGHQLAILIFEPSTMAFVCLCCGGFATSMPRKLGHECPKVATGSGPLALRRMQRGQHPKHRHLQWDQLIYIEDLEQLTPDGLGGEQSGQCEGPSVGDAEPTHPAPRGGPQVEEPQQALVEHCSGEEEDYDQAISFDDMVDLEQHMLQEQESQSQLPLEPALPIEQQQLQAQQAEPPTTIVAGSAQTCIQCKPTAAQRLAALKLRIASKEAASSL